MRPVAWLAALATLALAVALPAGAASLETLEPGWVLRARINGEPPVTGKLLRRDPGRITVSAAGAERELTLAGLEGLEVRTGQTRRGALIGVIAGMGVGMVIAQRAGSSGWFADGGNLMVILEGGLAGFTVGALAGSQVRTWEPVPLR
jgi:hypothetical protein